MTLKEKAKELVWKFYNNIEHTISDEYADKDWEIAKQCAILSVDEILYLLINVYGFDEFDNGKVEYWQEVKHELEKL
jgi:hypothetical protein